MVSPRPRKEKGCVVVVGGSRGMVNRAKSSMEIEQLKLKKHPLVLELAGHW